MVALLITLGIGSAVFRLFHQNERLFRDQMLVTEMQQSARLVASQIAEEVRMAGQGVPVYAAGFDGVRYEAATALLPTSTVSRIDFRAALSGAETRVTAAVPLDLTLGLQQIIAVENGGAFSEALGTSNPSGKFVYLWGPTASSQWTWARAELTAVNSSTLTVVSRQFGDSGRNGDTIRFTEAPAATLEEAVSFSLNGTSVRRANAADLADLSSPAWSAANEIGRNFTSLDFTYYDENGNVVVPDSLSRRNSVASIDVRVTVQTAGPLTTGERPTYTLALRTSPRNLKLGTALRIR